MYRHYKTPIGTFDAPDAPFHHVYIDLVGPLFSLRVQRFLLTCVDRFTRWCEAIPLADSNSETFILAILQNRIVRFGAPKAVTINRGPQFESTCFVKFGCERIRTSAYPPTTNGMIERNLLIALLGIPSCFRLVGRLQSDNAQAGVNNTNWSWRRKRLAVSTLPICPQAAIANPTCPDASSFLDS